MNASLHTIGLLCCCLFTGALAAADDLSVPIEQLTPGSSHQGWGALQLDKAVAGTPLSIHGRSFKHGLGTHAHSEIVYDLDQEYRSFSAWVGVDENLKNHPEAPKASASFQVFGDGKQLFDSGVMRITDDAKRVDVPLAGVSELKLVVTDGGDGISCDHADWADAGLVRNAAVSADKPAKFTISNKQLAIHLTEDGRIADAAIGDNPNPWMLRGRTRLTGCQPGGETRSEALPDGGRIFRRALKDARGRTCELIDRYTPEADNIRWDIEITSQDPNWTTPVQTIMECGKPQEKLIWTAWGSPDFSGDQWTPELAAKIQAGKASVSGVWSDPLVPVGFLNRSWHYGNVAQGCPVGSDFIALPLFTVLDPGRDQGISLVLSADDVLLNLDLAVSSAGGFRFTRANHRLGSGTTQRFTLHLVPHEASWRGGLRFLTTHYPQYFEPPNPKAHRIAGCGAYSTGEEPIDAAKFREMAFGFNWKLSDDFPYMGMFLPPVKDADETWARSGDEASAAYKGPLSSCGKMNDYARTMKRDGFAVLGYFNVTEFGKNMYGRKATLPPDAPDLWKDPVAFLHAKLPNAVFDPGIGTCYRAYIVDPGDPDYLTFMLEQADRHIRMLPDFEGICIDRADWLRLYNPKADDGVTWLGDKPARSLFRSWLALMEKLGPRMHEADKVIFSNMMTVRLELCRELDGIYTEFGNNGNALNASALLGLRKPVAAWTYNQTLREPDPDSFMQRHLHMGCFPTAPYPHNNHCVNPEPAADRLYQDYGPLLGAMRGRTWVLAPHCVETTTPGVKVNLFEIPDGFAMPVTFGGGNREAVIRLRNLPDLTRLKAAALHPGVQSSVPLEINAADGTVTVPLRRGCAMVRLSRHP